MTKLITHQHTVRLPYTESLGYYTSTTTERFIELETTNERVWFISALRLLSAELTDEARAKDSALLSAYEQEYADYVKELEQYNLDMDVYNSTNVFVRVLFRTEPRRPHEPVLCYADRGVIEYIQSFPTTPHLLYDPVPEWLFKMAIRVLPLATQ